MVAPASPHVVAYASSHGFGHAAIIRAVARTLLEIHPTVRVSVISHAPEDFFVHERVSPRFALIRRHCPADFGLRMTSSVDISLPRSIADYRSEFNRWGHNLRDEKEFLRQRQADLVLTCSSFLPLQAAKGLGLPGFTVGPFTWFDILDHYCGELSEDPSFGGVIGEAYAAATGVLSCAPFVSPHMDYPVWQKVGPIGIPPVGAKDRLRHALGCGADQAIALVAMGGIPEKDWDTTHWDGDGGRWIFLNASDCGHGPSAKALGLTVGEAIASSDVVITKPGYGTFVEAAHSGTAIISRERPGWPENSGLMAWAGQHVPVAEMSDADFLAGTLLPALNSLALVGPRSPVTLSGKIEVAKILLSSLEEDLHSRREL